MDSVFSDRQQRIIDLARSWLGTPYRHQCSSKGIGCDCIGLVRGVWREFYGHDKDPTDIPPYQSSWYEVDQRDTMLVFGRRYLVEVGSLEEAVPGDVLAFRMKRGVSVKHCGILVSTERMVHSYSNQAVFEVDLGDWWRERVVTVLRFP